MKAKTRGRIPGLEEALTGRGSYHDLGLAA
jgi:hypothetical protein